MQGSKCVHQRSMEEGGGPAFTLVDNHPWSSFAQQEEVCGCGGRRSPASHDPDAVGPSSKGENTENLPEKKNNLIPVHTFTNANISTTVGEFNLCSQPQVPLKLDSRYKYRLYDISNSPHCHTHMTRSILENDSVFLWMILSKGITCEPIPY